MTDQFNFDNPIIPGSIWDKNADYKIPVVSSVGNGPKGDKGDPLVFNDLTPEQIDELATKASYVTNEKVEASFCTVDQETSVIHIPIDDYDKFDILLVDIEGLDIHEGQDYEIVNGDIILDNPIVHPDTKVNFTAIRYATIDGDKTIIDNTTYVFKNGGNNYETAADMIADTTLRVGDICHIDSYETPNDGKGGFYEIKSTGSADGYLVITVGNFYAHRVLDADQFAVKRVSDKYKRVEMIPYPDFEFWDEAPEGQTDVWCPRNDFDVPARILYVKEDRSLQAAIFNGGCGMIADGNDDLSEAIAITNTYLANADKLMYGRISTGDMWTGTLDNPYPVNPKGWYDARNNIGYDPDQSLHPGAIATHRMNIDCVCFTGMAANGVPYRNSVYHISDVDPSDESLARNYYANKEGNRMYHPIMNPIASTVKPYWWQGLYDSDVSLYGYMGTQRLAPISLAKILYDAGKLKFVHTKGALVPGAVMFYGCGETSPWHWDPVMRPPGHCYMVTGYIKDQYIISDSTSKKPQNQYGKKYSEYGGPITRKIPSYFQDQSSVYYMPPYTGGIKMQNNLQYYNYVVERSNVDLSSGNGFHWNPGIDAQHEKQVIGARVVSVTPTQWGDYSFHVKLTNTFCDLSYPGDPNPEVIEVDFPCQGRCITFYFPYGWELDLTSTDNTPVNIVCNVTCSDKFIKLASH